MRDDLNDPRDDASWLERPFDPEYYPAQRDDTLTAMGVVLGVVLAVALAGCVTLRLLGGG